MIYNQRKTVTLRGVVLVVLGMMLFAVASISCGYAFSRVAPPKVTVIPVMVKECIKGRNA